MRSFVFAAVLLAVTAACSKPVPPVLTPERATITKVTPLGVELHVEMNAQNPNSVDLSAREVTAHVVVNKKYDMGTVTIPKAIALPAGQTTKLDVPMTATWSDLGALVQLGAGNGPVPYTVDGTLSLGGDLVSVSVPFHLEGSVTHEQIVSATLHSLPAIPGLTN